MLSSGNSPSGTSPKAAKLEIDLAVDADSLEESSDIKAVILDQVVSVTPLIWS